MHPAELKYFTPKGIEQTKDFRHKLWGHILMK